MAATSMAAATLNLSRSFMATDTRIANSGNKPAKSLSLLASKHAAVSGAGTAIAGAVFSVLAASEPAVAAQQVAEIADGDNRGLALLIPIVPALGWVLFNILQPALNQINRMRNSKAVIVGLGVGGLSASGFFLHSPAASAGEIASLAEAAADNNARLLLSVAAPAIGWILFNVFQPALNRINTDGIGSQ